MSASEDEDLPSISFGQLYDALPADQSINVDVDLVIQECENRKEKRRQIVELQATSEDLIVSPISTPPPLQPPQITAFPPKRALFRDDLSLVCFNKDTLQIPRATFPDALILDENYVQFFQWLKLKVLSSPLESCREIFQFLWFVQSVHPNPQVIWQCNSLLLELNHRWNLKWEEVILVFRNWGAHLEDILRSPKAEKTDVLLPSSPRFQEFELFSCCAGAPPEDILTSWKAEQIEGLLPPSPRVAPYNVQSTLRILSEQLNNSQLTGDVSSQKALFFLLTLLSLDPSFSECLPEIQTCLHTFYDQLSERSAVLVPEYCRTLLDIEPDYARLAYVAQCVLPEGLRCCLALPLAQRMFKIEPVTYIDSLEPADLCDILSKHLDDLMKLELHEVHSFLIIVDCAVAHFVSTNSDKTVHTELLAWLRDLSHALVNSCSEKEVDAGGKENDGDATHALVNFCSGKEVDIDATLIRELVSRLQTEWEEAWNDVGNCEENIVMFSAYSESSNGSDSESDQEVIMSL